MKKMNRAISVVLIILTAIAGFTCKPGLGSQIDILPPSGEIIYPDAGETPIRGSFILRGTAKDDEGVRAVSIVFENIETKDSTRSFPASLSKPGADSTEWTVSIDNEPTGTEAPPHELVKIYPMPDGEYTAIVTVTDKGGKPSTFTKNYKIDNTPPVFIVQRPSTVAGKDEIPVTWDGYGAIFSVVGQAGERNTVEKLDVRVTGAEPIQTMFVGNNINAQIAVFRKTDPKDPLYELQDKDKTKPLKGEFYLYDNARERTGGGASTEGNKADWYYQWEDVYTDVIAKGYTPEVISDYFAGKKGSNKNEHDQKILALRGDTDALNTLKSAMIKMEEKRSTFKLDPSTSPGFKVIGIKNLPKNTLNLAQATSMLFKTGTETAFPVELIRNKNKDSLINGIASNPTAYTGSNIEIVLFKWNGTGSGEDSFKNNTNLEEKTLVKFSELTDTNKIASKITVADGNLRVKCTFDPSWGEGYYIVKVKGTDTIDEESHKFQEYDDSNSVNDGMYIINFLAVGTGPRIRPIRPQGFKNTTVDIEADVTGIDATGEVYYNIDAPVNTASPDPAKKLIKVNSDPTDSRYKAAGVTISGLSDGIHKIHFLAKTSSGSTDTDTTEFTVDKTGPTIEIVYPEETDPQAGDIVVSGRISDEWAGVNPEKTKYILGKKTPAPTVNTAAGWKIMKDAADTSTKGSWSIHINLDNVPSSEHGAAVGRYRKIPLYVFTEDELGNKAVREKQILFDTEGTKPIVKVLSPQNTTPTTKLGGTIQIFGTASVPKGGPAAVREVYIQFSRDGNFTSAADGTFGTIDWYNGGNGQLIPGTDTNGGADWRISINGDGSFNHATNQNQDVYFRVRAKNKNGTSMGDWSDKIKIIVDKSAPTIGSPNAVKVDDSSSTVLAGSANAKDYTPNMWVGRNKKLIGSLKDDSGIKAVQIASTGLAGGVNYDLAQAKAVGWIADAADGNYELKIPFDLDALSSAAKAAGEFSVTVSITENTTSPALSTQQTFTFRFDTTDPIGDFGTERYVSLGNFTSSSITDAQLAQKVKDLGATTSSGGGCKIVADNHILTVTKVTGDKIEFTASPALTAGRHSYILYKPETLIYKNNSGKWIVNGVANDSGSGVAEVKAWVSVETDPLSHTVIKSPETVINETDNANRITKQLGGTVTWKGLVDFGSVPDGKGTLHYTITDKSGNTYTPPGVDVVVKNKPIMVSAVTLSTDIGGTPSSFIGGLSGHLNANRNFIGSVTSTEFAFKNKDNSKIKVDFTGGQGAVKYRLKKGDDTTELQPLTPITSGSEIDLKNHLTAIGNSNGTPTKIILELWDEAHGFTVGTDTAFAKITIKTLFEAIDTKPPAVVILPFHWNKEDDNSLYQNSRANGHVEIDTSSVSGKITIRGFAYDNIKLDKIEATFQDAAPLNVTATRTGNTWASNKTMAANDVELKVTHLGADYLGYYVKWELSFDSSKIPMGVAKDIKVIANDGGSNSVESEGTGIPGTSNTVTRGADNSASHASFASAKVGQFVVFRTGEKQYFTRISGKNGNTITLANSVPADMDKAAVYDYTANKTKTAVKSVPYITSVSRKSTYNTKRARSGAIPLLRGEEGNTITGFNFDNGSGTSLKITANKNGTGSSVTMDNLTLSGSSFTFKVPDTAKDGYLHLVVNGVAAVNNTNAYTESNMEKSDTYGIAKHSDDRLVHIWRVNKEDTFKGSRNAIYPAMSKANDGTLYASFSNYSESRVFYSNKFTGNDPIVVGGDGTTRLFTGYDPPEETDITVSGSGGNPEVNVLYAANYHGGRDSDWGNGDSSSPWNDTDPVNAGGLYLYDKDAPIVTVGANPDRYARLYRFELFTYDNELQQFKNIRTVRSGNNIYVVYYDRLTGAVKFAWVDDSKTPDTSLKALPWCVIDGNTDVTDTNSKVPDHPADSFTFVSPNGTAYASPYVLSNFEDGLSVSHTVWESIAVATTTQGYPIVVYMDATTGRLRLARSTSPQPTSSSDWKVQSVLASSDPNGKLASNYINACIGTDGILHIAFQNTKGQLVYVKSTNRSDTGSTKYTFGTSEVLDDSGMSIDMTMNGATPYISYVFRPNSYDAIRIAYKTSMDFNNTGTDVEGWETMTAPLNERAANSRICIETQAKHYVSSGTASKMPVAVGFKTNSDYRAAFYVGK